MAAAIPGRIGSTIVCLTAIRLEIGREARISAYRRDLGNKSSGSQPRQASPIRKVSSASIHSEDINSQAAFCRPTSCGSRYEEAASGATPKLVKGHFRRAVDDMKTRSA